MHLRPWGDFDPTSPPGRYDATSSARYKLRLAQDLGLEAFCEDDELIGRTLAEAGVRVWLFDQPWNRALVHPNIERVTGWSDVAVALALPPPGDPRAAGVDRPPAAGPAVRSAPTISSIETGQCCPSALLAKPCSWGLTEAPDWSHTVVMRRSGAGVRRPRLYVDVSESVSARVRQIADRFFRGVTNDAVLAALSAFAWMLDQRLAGRRVISVEVDALPSRYSEAILPGVNEAMGDENWTWLIAQPHPWRKQLWIKGRQMTAGQLVGHLSGNGWSADETARQFSLPVEAVLEAQRYVAANRALVDAEAIEEERAAKRLVNVHPPERVGALTP